MAIFFHSRVDAARRLAKALARYRGRNPLVLAIPRGAVEMGRVVADELGGELDVVLVRKLYHGRVRRGPAWDCGYPQQTARMQDTAEGFGQPIKQIFEPVFMIDRQVPSPFDDRPRYQSRVEDKLWYALYLPVARVVERISAAISILQSGRIHIYLLYSFATLLLLLIFIR